MCGTIGAIPLIFAEHRGWQQLSSTLPFLALLVGSTIGAAINVYNQLVYNRMAAGKVNPELRLPPMMLGSVLFTTGESCYMLSSALFAHEPSDRFVHYRLDSRS